MPCRWVLLAAFLLHTLIPQGAIAREFGDGGTRIIQPDGYTVAFAETDHDSINAQILLDIVSGGVLESATTADRADDPTAPKTFRLTQLKWWKRGENFQIDGSVRVTTVYTADCPIMFNFHFDPQSIHNFSPTITANNFGCNVLGLDDYAMDNVVSKLNHSALFTAPYLSDHYDDPNAEAFMSQATVAAQPVTTDHGDVFSVTLSWAQGAAATAFAKTAGLVPPFFEPPPDGLARTRAAVRRWLTPDPVIPDALPPPKATAPDGSKYPIARDKTDEGDISIFDGLLCAAGYQDGCNAVREAQGHNGQPWRSPAMINTWPSGGQMSGDQLWGVLLYVARTEDKTYFRKFLGFLRANRVHFPDRTRPLFEGSKTCLGDPGAQEACSVNGEAWMAIQLLAKKLGMTAELPNGEDDATQKYGFTTRQIVWEAFLGPYDYQSHLLGVEIWLYRMLGLDDENLRLAARILAGRQPKNAFFSHLADPGLDKPSLSTFNAFHQQCGLDAKTPTEQGQWVWERPYELSPGIPNPAWQKSEVWDCVFAGYFLYSGSPM